jgi:hypothetical protein
LGFVTITAVLYSYDLTTTVSPILSAQVCFSLSQSIHRALRIPGSKKKKPIHMDRRRALAVTLVKMNRLQHVEKYGSPWLVVMYGGYKREHPPPAASAHEGLGQQHVTFPIFVVDICHAVAGYRDLA